jgi:hypothetical protein
MEASLELRARRRRANLVRRRVVLASVLAFVLAWLVIFGQLAAGGDPVLAAQHARQTRVLKARRAERRRQAQQRQLAQQRQQQEQQYYYDGAGGQTYQAPPQATYAPEPAPVVTQQS